MKKELLKKGDKVLYKTLGCIRPAEVKENNPEWKEIKIKLDFHRAMWVDYKNIIIEK